VINLLPSPLAASGGVFQLDREPARDISQLVDTGWSAAATARTKDLVVSGPPGATGYDDALEDAVGAAPQALDLLAVTSGVALTIEGAETSHLFW
jgi:hypothetical protein